MFCYNLFNVTNIVLLSSHRTPEATRQSSPSIRRVPPPPKLDQRADNTIPIPFPPIPGHKSLEFSWMIPHMWSHKCSCRIWLHRRRDQWRLPTCVRVSYSFGCRFPHWWRWTIIKVSSTSGTKRYRFLSSRNACFDSCQQIIKSRFFINNDKCNEYTKKKITSKR